MAGMNMSIASQERLSAPSQPPLIHVKQGLSAGGPPPATTSRAATAITAAAATGNANGIAADERWPVPAAWASVHSCWFGHIVGQNSVKCLRQNMSSYNS